MSRIGKQIINIPEGVKVDIKSNIIKVSGPKSTLNLDLPAIIKVKLDDKILTVDVPEKEDKHQRALWGSYASHIKNMVVGVSEGFTKQLEINGVGYRAAMQGNDIKLEVGFSHPVVYKVPEGVSAKVEKNLITLESANKPLLGQVASEIRKIRKPEPYKGKGIKYVEEQIRRKAGKAAKAAGGE